MVAKERWNVWSEYPMGRPRRRWCGFGQAVLGTTQFLAKNKGRMPVASLVPIAPTRTQKALNLWLLQQSIPRANNQGFVPIRGVQFWVDNDMCQNCFHVELSDRDTHQLEHLLAAICVQHSGPWR